LFSIFADAGGYKLELSDDDNDNDDGKSRKEAGGESLFDREVRLTREAEIVNSNRESN
jgi:hypothetical protein